MYSKGENSVSGVLVRAVIEDINSMHFLGSSNHKVDPTGGLSGYYRNVAARVYANYLTRDGKINPSLYPYLMMATIRHTGAGNCGEMAGAFYTALQFQDLSPDQKRSIHLKSYDTNDAHRTNSYVLVGESVFDIWAKKSYKKSRIKAETHKAEKYHQTLLPINPMMNATQVSRVCDSIYEKFTTAFERELSIDRQTNRMYVTFDSSDPSDYALFANQAFPWLFNKLIDTISNPYFKTHSELARDIQTKILNNFIYLIEELRKDVPMEQVDIHPKQRKHSDNEIRQELLKLLNNDYVVTWLIAMSYRNSQPARCLQFLEELLITLSGIENDGLVDLLVNLTEQTMKQLATLNPGGEPAGESLPEGDSEIGSTSTTETAGSSPQPSASLSNHVALSIFSSSPAGVAIPDDTSQARTAPTLDLNFY